MLLGIAIGDSLGHGSESKTPMRRRANFGFIDDYLPDKYEYYRRIGIPTDDTQLSFDTLMVILNNGYLNMQELADTFSSHRIRGIGGTVKAFLRNYKKFKMPWYQAGIASSGNGALMRIAPVLIPYFLGDLSGRDLWSDVILATMMTHNDPLAIGSSLAYVDLLTNYLTNEQTDPYEVLNRFCIVLSASIGEKRYGRRRVSKATVSLSAIPLVGKRLVEVYPQKFIKKNVEHALRHDVSVEKFGNGIGSGAYLLETVPVVLYILLKNKDKPRDAVLEAVNYTRDNDTIASIVGDAVGARFGKSAFKESWISGLSGRIREHDDGTIFKLIEDTRHFLNK
jgi:ADP-ribosylglycohydrolase